MHRHLTEAERTRAARPPAPVAAPAPTGADLAGAIGNRAFAAAVAGAAASGRLQRTSLDELTERVSKGASDDAAIAELGILDKHEGITDAELELLHVDDLRALRRYTNSLIEHHSQGRKSDNLPIWVESATLFVTERLEPKIAVKLRGGEVARLFWPLVERLKDSLGEGRIGNAFLNVLPHTQRYLSTMSGKALAAGELSAQEASRIGALGSRFEITLLEWSRKEYLPTPDELVATFQDAPRRFAELLYEAISEEEVLEAFKASEVDWRASGAAELQAHADARVERLARQLKTKLLTQDKDWWERAMSFQELTRMEVGAMPRAVKYALFKVNELASDGRTVISCYWTVDEPPPAESQQERFERSLAELSGGQGDPDAGPLLPRLGPALLGLTSHMDGAREARLSSGAWVEVEVIAQRNGRYRVHPLGLTTAYDEEVAAEDLRPKSGWSKGDEVRILHAGTLYPSRVLDVRAEEPRVKVHWYGYPETQQTPEWVSTENLRQG